MSVKTDLKRLEQAAAAQGPQAERVLVVHERIVKTTEEAKHVTTGPIPVLPRGNTTRLEIVRDDP
jgi:hypothetical protein